MLVTFNNPVNQFGYSHESTIDAAIDGSALVADMQCNEFDSSKLLDLLKEHCSELLLTYLRGLGIDPLTFEDGYDQWWGMGSVTMFELDLKFNFDHAYDSVKVKIYK
jgi:hypothetical protein